MNNIILFLLNLWAVFAPDLITKIFTNYNKIIFVDFLFLPIALFAIFLSFANRKFYRYIMIYFLLWQMAQYVHLFLIGSFISPMSLGLLIFATDDLTSGLLNIDIYNIAIPVLIILSSFLPGIIFNEVKSRNENKFFTLCAIGVILLPTYYILDRKYPIYYANPQHFSLKNTIYCQLGFILKILPKSIYPKQINLKTYQMQKNNIKQEHVILVIFESLNYKYMNLYGYKDDNTPNLKKLKNGYFDYKPGISSSIATRSSIPLILYPAREPTSIGQLIKQHYNLFAAAKLNNFQTHLYTGQSLKLFSLIDSKDIDYEISYENFSKEIDLESDEYIIDRVKNIDFTQKQFIVLHLKDTVHFPYDRCYKNHKELCKFPRSGNYHDNLLNEYSNGIIYADYLINKLTKILGAKNINYQLFMTSDHGEKFNEENNGYFHGVLDYHTSYVPIICYSNYKKCNIGYNHYQMTKSIFKELGYDIINPNEVENEYYIQGINILEYNDYIKYRFIKNDIQFDDITIID